MTRRIATAILLTVWTILVVGGLGAYFATQAVLVGDLDDRLTRRAEALADAAARGESVEAAATRLTPSGQYRFYVEDESGQTIGRSTHGPADVPSALPRKAAFIRLDGQLMRTVTVQLPARREGGSTYTVVYSGDADQIDRVLTRLAWTLGVCGLAAGAAAAAVAARVARAALRPLRDASDVIGQIDERRLDRRIDADSLPPELRPPAARLNDMLERLERAFAQRKQFLADASHELRTPVAALVTTIEVALRRRRGAEELERTLESCLADARQLKRLVHALMEHARGEATAAHAEAAETVDVAQLLEECADVAQTLAAAKDVRLERSVPGPMPAVTQPQRLRSVVMNLLSNAVSYNRPGGLIELGAGVEAGMLTISVRDTGRGIAAEHLPHVFEPFYRADGTRRSEPAAGAEEPHLGLGLFLVDSHLKALGGRCTVQSEVGVGTTFVVTLPAGAVAGGRGTAVNAGGHGSSGVGGAGSVNISPPAAVWKGVRVTP